MQKLLVCLCVGQNQGVGAGGGWWVFMKSLQKSIVHIYSCLICLGGRPYVRHDVTHARFYQKLDLDPWALDPSPPIFLKNSWTHSPGIHRTFKSDQYLCILLISSLKMHPWLHNNYLKFLDPWALGPHHPRFLLKNHWILTLVVHTIIKSDYY